MVAGVALRLTARGALDIAVEVPHTELLQENHLQLSIGGKREGQGEQEVQYGYKGIIYDGCEIVDRVCFIDVQSISPNFMSCHVI